MDGIIEDYTRDHVKSLVAEAEQLWREGQSDAAILRLIEAISAILDTLPVRYQED